MLNDIYLKKEMPREMPKMYKKRVSIKLEL